MTTLIVKGAGTRLRRTPSTTDTTNVITSLNAGTRLNGVLDDNWYEVTAYIHASVVSALPDPTPAPDGAIPYLSQWDATASSRGADCGQTCVAMLAAWKGISVAVDDLRFQSASNGLSTAADLVKNFESIGLLANWRYLANGETPPPGAICLVQYRGFLRDHVQDRSFTGGHWVVYLEQNVVDVVVHDPDWWGARRSEGAFKHYTLAEWNAAFLPSGAGQVIVTLA